MANASREGELTTGDGTTEPDLRTLVDRERSLLSDVSALVELLHRSRQAEWVAASELARDTWAGIDVRRTNLRVGPTADVWADPGWLRLAFAALFEKVHAPAEADVVEIGVEGDCLYVTDDGPRVDVAERDGLVESGARSDRDRTGYGLTVVEHVVRGHDWGLRLRDAAKGGLRVEITGVTTKTQTSESDR